MVLTDRQPITTEIHTAFTANAIKSRDEITQSRNCALVV